MLDKSGNTDLAAEFRKLQPLMIFGHSVITRRNRDRVFEIINYVKSLDRDQVRMFEKEFTEAAKAVTETNSNLTEITNDLKAMTGEAAKLETKLLKAAKRSEETLNKFALKK